MLSHSSVQTGHSHRAGAAFTELFGGTLIAVEKSATAAPAEDIDPLEVREWQRRFVRNHARQLIGAA
jgi:hypothetical protein